MERPSLPFSFLPPLPLPRGANGAHRISWVFVVSASLLLAFVLREVALLFAFDCLLSRYWTDTDLGILQSRFIVSWPFYKKGLCTGSQWFPVTGLQLLGEPWGPYRLCLIILLTYYSINPFGTGFQVLY